MSALVNGVPTTPDIYGTIEGTSGSDHISGTAGTDHIRGSGGVDYLYGGAGNDAFIFAETDFNPGLGANGVQDYVYDFGGAGGYTAGNNDFLAFTGFGAGSTLTFDAARSAQAAAYHGGDATLQYYTIHSGHTGNDYALFVHSVDAKVVIAGDYAFY